MMPFVEMTEGIGGEKWVKILSVRPLIQKITSCFLQISDNDHNTLKEVKEVMLHKIDQYYGEGCDLAMLDKAMLLDPRFKNVTFVSSDILLPELVEVTSNTLSVPCGSQSAAENFNESSAPKRQKTHGKLMTLLTNFLQSPDEITDPTEKAKIEMQMYMADVIIEQYDSHGHLNPLVWWKQNATRYPCLASLARKYLAIPATSVPAEKSF